MIIIIIIIIIKKVKIILEWLEVQVVTLNETFMQHNSNILLLLIINLLIRPN